MRNFKGCVIVVSHDRYFMDKVVDHLWYFRGRAMCVTSLAITRNIGNAGEKQKFEREQQKDLLSKTKEPPVQKASRTGQREQKA